MEQKKISPANTLDARLLTSWKEIAQFLGINIRTAQKWERERKLPVRRASDRRNRISADPADLESWRRQLIRVTSEERHYQWPLGRDLTVEMRFLGVALERKHIDLLRQYLDLLKDAFP